jgi:WD40 repeat protein
MSSFTLENTLYIVTCRYLGNFFKVLKNNEKYIDVLCEDFVNCLICRQYSISEIDDIFIYTGLRNGKLIEWQYKENKDNNGIIKPSIKEKRSNYFHKDEITCLELYDNQNIIITGGKDKMIFIRKIVDFELLTVINLTHLYANPIIGKTFHIVPTLIKVSELNNIYVMLYNYETRKSFIRGYNLNGLFFSQSVEDDFMNICFTENCNLLVSFYNQNKISILKCYDLKEETFIKEATYFLGNKKSGTTPNLTWIDYNYKNKEFIVLFKDKIAKGYMEVNKALFDF